MKEKMIIGPPVLSMENEKVIYSAPVYENGKEKLIYFKFSKEYGKYLDEKNSDALLCALLYYAMNKNLDIEINGFITEQLYYQLTNYFIPVLADSTNFFHYIDIKTQLYSNPPDNVGAVGTGISGGVDSLYTIKKYKSSPLSSYNLSHVIFCDIFTAEYSEEERNGWLKKNITLFEKLTKDLNLKLIVVETNLDKEFSVKKQEDKIVGIFQDAGLFTLKYCSIVLALRKLFKIYYFSSGYEIKDFNLQPKPYDTAVYDLFNLKCLSTKNLIFYSSGSEVSRLQKLEYLLNDIIAQKYLQVCSISDNNCGRCEKCVRTMGELYVLGNLEAFIDVFPVEDFKNNLAKRFGLIRAAALQKNVFDKEILKIAKQNEVYIPKSSYFYCILDFIIDIFRRKFSDNKLLRKIYYYFNFDEYRFGVRTRRKGIK